MSYPNEPAITIIYDGACPFCSTYVRMIRLSQAIYGRIELISARDTHLPIVGELLDQGYDLDAGMAVIYQGEIYHGPDALHLLTLISTRSGLFNRLMKWIFSNKRVIRLAYPVLRLARNIAVKIKGKPYIRRHG